MYPFGDRTSRKGLRRNCSFSDELRGAPNELSGGESHLWQPEASRGGQVPRPVQDTVACSTASVRARV